MNLVSRGHRTEELPLTKSSKTTSSSPNTNSLGSNNTSPRESSSKSFRKYADSRRDVSGIQRQVRLLRHQYVLLRTPAKVVVTFLGCMLLYFLLITPVDYIFQQEGKGKPSISKETTFAIAINSYKRPAMLQEAITYYSSTCGRRSHISQIYVIWAEQTPKVPAPESYIPNTISKADFENWPELHVLKKDKDSLNSRFEPISQLDTTAVLMVDDDIRVECSALVSAFNAWKANPESMVGYYPRLAKPNRRQPDKSKTIYTYYTWPTVAYTHKFNIILTKAGFLHSKYLDLYTDDKKFPKEVKDYVDKHMNCEDIAMSMLVANHTRSLHGSPIAPIYVEGKTHDRGVIGGISTTSGHFAARSDCLSDLTELLGKHGWKPPMEETTTLGESAWIQHSPGFPWQYQPANLFEWITKDLIFA